MHKHKNDYTCVVFFPEGSPKKWTYVHALDGFVKFLNKDHSGWKYCNVYERRTGKYLKRFYPGNIVPKFLTSLLMLGLSLLTALSGSSQPLNSTFNKKTFKSEALNPYPKPLFYFLHLQKTESFLGCTFNNGFNNTATMQNGTPSIQRGLYE